MSGGGESGCGKSTKAGIILLISLLIKLESTGAIIGLIFSKFG